MNTSPIVARIWDYGWLCKDQITLPAVGSDAALIEQYISSPTFHTSFLPSDKDETGIHGPFIASKISTSDFVKFEPHQTEIYLKDLLNSEEWSEPADAYQFSAVFQQLQNAFDSNSRCYLLRFSEADTELMHDWGFVFTVFREFLFVDNARDTITRFVLGYD